MHEEIFSTAGRLVKGLSAQELLELPVQLMQSLEALFPPYRAFGLRPGDNGLLEGLDSRVTTPLDIRSIDRLPHELGLLAEPCPVAWHERFTLASSTLATLTIYGPEPLGGDSRAASLASMILLVLGLSARSRQIALSVSDSARLTEAIMDTAVDAILTIDEKGLIQSYNRGAERHFGFTAEEVLGQNVKLLMPEPYRDEHDGYIKSYLETGRKKIIGIGRRVLARRKDGSVFDAHLAVSEVQHLPGGRLFTGFIRDISDLVAAQAELVRAERELERQMVEHLRREEEVKSKAIHDERQHLSRELHDSVSQALYGIVLGARAATALLKQDPARATEPLAYVLSLAEAGLSEMRALLFDLRPDSLQSEGLVAAFSKHVKSLAQRYELEFDLDMGEEPEAPVEIKHAIHRLTMEAVHNVVKHASARRIEVRLGHEPPWLVVQVTDNGQGFDRTRVPEGLGITSMRERLDELGGHLELESQPGQGTRVRALFPLSPRATP